MVQRPSPSTPHDSSPISVDQISSSSAYDSFLSVSEERGRSQSQNSDIVPLRSLKGKSEHDDGESSLAKRRKICRAKETLGPSIRSSEVPPTLGEEGSSSRHQASVAEKMVNELIETIAELETSIASMTSRKTSCEQLLQELLASLNKDS